MQAMSCCLNVKCFSSPTFVRGRQAVVGLGSFVVIFLLFLLFFLLLVVVQVSVVEAGAAVLALPVADAVDLAAKQADAAGAGAAASHGGDKVHLLQQLLQLLLHRHVKPVDGIQHAVNWSQGEGVRRTGMLHESAAVKVSFLRRLREVHAGAEVQAGVGGLALRMAQHGAPQVSQPQR
ncbi:hypothetical protein EYF80_056990 [Liparis tanakae]|uniref:Uncharacterized protein n=1 Tax=Liparis tanakae TaxID=230148 RepID=A0A4Z2EVL4_9TELE|nr:hypothetical protein EYF80_056990 [Liparis tanakae]